MEINRSNINELVNKCQVKPDKDYGQNFLIEPTFASKICEYLNLDKNDKVLEIGPGLGSLTHFLVNNCQLTVCDIDSRMIDFLKIFFGVLFLSSQHAGLSLIPAMAAERIIEKQPA